MPELNSIPPELDKNKLPRHIAIIMDGNGRWATKHGKSRVYGHKNGVKSVREVTEACAELGVEYLTLYAFSTENWNRPRREIDALMSLLVSTLRKETRKLNENQIRLKTIGELETLPTECRKELEATVKATANNTRMTLILALSYSSRWEITRAARLLAEDVKNGLITTQNIDANVFSSYLTTHKIPDPELLIRTSGELRISNFLLWQIAYTELYFTKKFWPEFRKQDLYEAIIAFQLRERRFGMTSEQLKKA